jgi:hypothetical protein
VGYHEAAWSRPAGESTAAWQRVAAFWRALSVPESVGLNTSVGRVGLWDVAPRGAAAGGEPTQAEVAAHEALTRAAMIDTPWSAAFISYLMRIAGFAGTEFAFSDSHSDYVQAALDASAAEASGQPATHAFRACDVASTRPRVGDLLCATRASTAGTVRFADLTGAMAARREAGRAFPMHCDLVVRADEGGDGSLDTVGGNVINSVTLTRMALDARKVLGRSYYAGSATSDACAGTEQPCRGHLSRRPWVVLLQFRH